MKKLLIFSWILLMTSTVLFTGCKKDDDDEAVLPTISLKSGTGYINANTSVGYGDTLLFGVTASSNGTDNLVKLKVYRNNATFLDSTVSLANFTMDVVAVKNTDSQEIWKFEVTDISGNLNSTSVTVSGAFGAINSFATIEMGAQDNTTIPSFLSFSNGTNTTYFQAAAFDHQADIDMFLFYEDTPNHQNYMTLASPGSNITGIFTGTTSPDNYTTKNVTFFVKTTLTTSQFDAINNDALILASFNPANKFKKAKTLTINDIYAFQLQSGKYGLFKVTQVTGTTDGSIKIAVKIQQ